MSGGESKFLGGMLGDISNRSVFSQILIGGAAGWCTGFAATQFGQVVGVVVGGVIIFIKILHQQRYFTWSKITPKLDKVTDRVETAVTGKEKSWVDKAERYVDRKVDETEDAIKAQTSKTKKWYSNLIGDENGPKLNELHVFLTAFAVGVALGFTPTSV